MSVDPDGVLEKKGNSGFTDIVSFRVLTEGFPIRIDAFDEEF